MSIRFSQEMLSSTLVAHWVAVGSGAPPEAIAAVPEKDKPQKCLQSTSIFSKCSLDLLLHITQSSVMILVRW